MEPDEELLRAVHSLSGTVKSLAATTAKMSSTLQATQDELAGLRLVCQAAFGALGDTQEGALLFPAALARVMEADTAHMLTTPVPDQTQERRREWMLRLLPPRTLQVLRAQHPSLQIGEPPTP